MIAFPRPELVIDLRIDLRQAACDDIVARESSQRMPGHRVLSSTQVVIVNRFRAGNNRGWSFLNLPPPR